MRLLLILAVATHLSAISAFAQSATFAKTNCPFIGNDRLEPGLSLDERGARRLEEYDRYGAAGGAVTLVSTSRSR
jgi:hypothetical protein